MFVNLSLNSLVIFVNCTLTDYEHCRCDNTLIRNELNKLCYQKLAQFEIKMKFLIEKLVTLLMNDICVTPSS